MFTFSHKVCEGDSHYQVSGMQSCLFDLEEDDGFLGPDLLKKKSRAGEIALQLMVLLVLPEDLQFSTHLG